MKLKRVGKRLLFYVTQGYALASLPFVFLGYATSIYYLAIERISFINVLFPNFTSFLLVASVGLIGLCGLIGYVFMKRSWLYRESLEVTVESNPYHKYKVVPVYLPLIRLARDMADERGMKEVTEQLDLILSKSV